VINASSRNHAFGHGTERTEANNRGFMKIKDTQEISQIIGMNFRSEMHYGWTAYNDDLDESNDLYFLLITRNGRGEELEEFYWDLEDPEKNWLRNKGIELIPYN